MGNIQQNSDIGEVSSWWQKWEPVVVGVTLLGIALVELIAAVIMQPRMLGLLDLGVAVAPVFIWGLYAFFRTAPAARKSGLEPKSSRFVAPVDERNAGHEKNI